MTTPTGPISLQDIKNEFNPTGTGVINLGDYYAGGPYVSNPPPTSSYQTAPIPTSGTISLGCFLGLSKYITNYSSDGSDLTSWTKSANQDYHE